MGIGSFPEIVGLVEEAMPWLLLGVPLIVAMIPATTRIRGRRALMAFLAVIALGAADAIAKIYVSAEVARTKHIRP